MTLTRNKNSALRAFPGQQMVAVLHNQCALIVQWCVGNISEYKCILPLFLREIRLHSHCQRNIFLNFWCVCFPWWTSQMANGATSKII